MFGGKIRDVGVIGLGIIGSRVAERLRRADYHVFVWNRTTRAVPGFLASPHEIAEVAQVIQIFVRDAEALLEVMNDMKPVLKKHHIICAHATVSKEAMLEAANIAAEMGAGFLDCPFTGSRMAAENGELVYYVGGDQKELEKATKVLEVSSKKIMHFGKVGDATVLKIVTNLVSGAVVGALAEALAITKTQGVEPEMLMQAFEGNANYCPLIKMKLPAMMTAGYEPHFSLKNMLKDGRYAQALAKEKDLAALVLDASVKAMDKAAKAGKGDLDYAVVFENFSTVKPDKPIKSDKIKITKNSGRSSLKASAFEEDAEESSDAESRSAEPPPA
jgi:3-hydroxyisobutyrate dehydrogenase-like beta-hydroxyacid dehydrogenase